MLLKALNRFQFRFSIAHSLNCGKNWRLEAQKWPQHRLIVVRGGKGSLHLYDRQTPLRRGQVFWGMPDEFYGIKQDSLRKLKITIFRFIPQTQNNKPSTIPRMWRKCMIIEPANFSLLESLAMRLADSVYKIEGSDFSTSLMRSLLWLLIHEEKTPAQTRFNYISFQDIKPAIEYQSQTKNQISSIADLARFSGLSESTFRRRMWSCYKQSPKTFFLKKRIERAKVLLLESSFTIAAIAEELGYSEISSFSRQFKKIVGVSPEAYRS
jgi:AraC family transcriptional regulator, arabinose operon regulatory protein